MELKGLKDFFSIQNVGQTDLFKQKARHLGTLNQGKIIYYIEEDNGDFGFFAMYRAWLEYLYFANVCGYIPVIRASENFLYKETKMINGTDNPFEYYFKQPSAISISNAQRSSKVVISNLMHRQMVELVLTGKYSNYKWNNRYIREMARVVKKYIRFNQQTWEYISEGTQKIGFAANKILGVHVRGTDFRVRYDNHPIYLEEKDCFKVIDPMLEDGKYSKLFLATDDNRILKQFINRYGEKLCYYQDVERGSKNQSVAFSKKERKNHKYLLGLEVIRDMYSLSMCSGLVAGISQVVVCAQINKLARGEYYEDLSIIDKGLYINGHMFSMRRRSRK